MKRWIVVALDFTKKRPKAVATGVILLIVSAALIVWRGYDPPTSSNEPEEAIFFVGGTKDANRRGNIIFVHGLGGDARRTWQGKNPGFFWPEQLGKRFPDCGVWSIAYDASPSKWLGSTMPITDRSKNLLEQMRLSELGNRPLVFIGHSLGGIVIKQMLRETFTQNNDAWEEIGNHTKGVIFLATPHTGSDAAMLLHLLKIFVTKPTVTVEELKPNAAFLRDLNDWYRNNIPKREVNTSVLYENKLVPRCPVLIVDETSSNPGITGVTPIRVNKDHMTICKVDTENDLVYKSVVDFVDQNLTPFRPPWTISFPYFVKMFNESRRNAVLLEAFKKDHVGQKVTWIAWVRKIVPDKENPAYMIGSTAEALAQDQVVANCSPRDFEKSTQIGTKVRIEGVIKESTSFGGAVLHECKIVEVIEVPSK